MPAPASRTGWRRMALSAVSSPITARSRISPLSVKRTASGQVYLTSVRPAKNQEPEKAGVKM